MNASTRSASKADALAGHVSPLRDFWRSFSTNKGALVGLVIVCLVLLLILGQALLLHHVIQHGQEHALGLHADDGGCSFCAVGGHMVTTVLSFQPVPSSVLVWVVCLLPAAQFIISPCLQAFGARGPPLLSVA